MKISASEAIQKLDALSMIPRQELSQETRVKIIGAKVAYNNINTKFQEEVQECLKELKPEGFDEQLQKYGNPADYKGDFNADFNEYKEAYGKVEADLIELQQNLAKEAKYEVCTPKFSDADFVDIARVIPSGGKTMVRESEVPNDDILYYLMSVL